CGVPRTKVYSTLKKLMERGLVVEEPGEPRKFAATSPAEAFEPYLERFREKTSERVVSLLESTKVVSFLEEAYKMTQLTAEPQKVDVWIIRGRAGVVQRIRGMLSRVQKSLDVITTQNGLILFYKTANRLLDKLVEKGVKVRIGAPINSYKGSLARELSYVCKVEHVDVLLPVLFCCADDHEFLLAELRPDDISMDSDDDLGIFSHNPTLCVFISLLLGRWSKEALSSRVIDLCRSYRRAFLKPVISRMVV
ncbi:MAG: TrmB family transcriptional regulator, partial [Candidatus Bathyarchaeia archaeon]